MSFGESDHGFELTGGGSDAFFGGFGVGAAYAAELEVRLDEFFRGFAGDDGMDARASVGDVGRELV